MLESEDVPKQIFETLSVIRDAMIRVPLTMFAGG
jgi:hypothetical protein